MILFLLGTYSSRLQVDLDNPYGSSLLPHNSHVQGA